MQTDFPFVEIPKELEPVIGEREEGTRIYRRDGSQEESAVWFDVLTQLVGPSVSPGGVGMYCPVSRAAVYKRIKEGKLSLFLFHVTFRKTTLFGKNKILRQNPYGYIPVSEAKAWREELEKRALEQGNITEEELEGSKPDWHGDFMDWKVKGERAGIFDGPNAFTPGQLALSLAKALLGQNEPSYEKIPGKGEMTRKEEADWLRAMRASDRKKRAAVKEIMAKVKKPNE